MFSAHDAYCDQRHTMRQRCNDDLRLAAAEDAAELARFGFEPPAPSSNGHTHDAPPAAEDAPLVAEGYAPSALSRDAVAAPEAPEAIPYVAREWARVAEAVDAREAGGRDDFDPASGGGVPAALRIGVIAAAGVAIVWLLTRRRSRPDEA
jgi:hypothetical protein